MEWIPQILQYVTAGLVYLGYPGVFVAMVMEGLGLPFPGDVFLAFYGYSVAEHSMHGITVCCFGTLGYFTGVSIVFLLTRRFEKVLLRPLYQMRLLNEARLQNTGGLMDRYAALVLIPGRFLPGIRSLSTYAAALSTMPYASFALYSIVGSIVWCGAWLGLGYWFGENVDAMMKHVQTTLMWVTIILVAGAIAYWLLRKWQAALDVRNKK